MGEGEAAGRESVEICWALIVSSEALPIGAEGVETKL